MNIDMTKSIDPEILGRILVLQSSLQAVPDNKRLGELICYALTNLPGIEATAFYLEQQLVTHFPSDSNQSAWPPSWQSTHQIIANDQTSFACLPLQTCKSVYGAIAFSLSDLEQFKVYLPHLENTANLIALMLENREQDAELRNINANLEEQVKDRVKSLRKSEERLSLALNATNTGIWDWNPKTGDLYFGANYFTMAGYKVDEFPHTFEEWVNRIHPNDLERVKSVVDAYLTGRIDTYNVEFRFAKNDGSWMWILAQGKIFEKDDQGNPVRFTGTHTDITERKQAEKALQLTRFSVDAASDSLFWITPDARFVDANTAACRTLGYTREELLQLSVPDVDTHYNAGIWQQHFAELRQRGSMTFESEQRTRDGRLVLVEVVANYVKHGSEELNCAFVRDITERKRAEEERLKLEQQFQHSQKLESLGVLSGGIAHDFNNILAVIMGYCSLSKMDNKNTVMHIAKIERAVERGAALCRQMLAYTGKTKIVKSDVKLGELLAETIKMLQATIPQNAVIKYDCPDDIPLMLADTSQISQVAMNLIINAAESIGAVEGEVRVTLSRAVLKEDPAEKDYLGKIIPPGEYACLDVTDNGCGMSDETCRRIFEPFYTTKFSGRGLGLSATIGIIASHGGAIQLFSQLGKGTTFKIYLPVQTSVCIEEQTVQLPNQADSWTGSGTILLVDDEDTLLLALRYMLKKLGFTVIEAANGKEALEAYQKNTAEITMVVTDMGMPVMNGYELFCKLKQLDPQLPIIISSGFGDDDIASRIPREAMAGMLNKPYTFEQLREVLMSVLEST